MSNPPNHLNNHPSSPKNPTFTPGDYELRIAGHLGPQTVAWFEDMTLAVNEETSPPPNHHPGHHCGPGCPVRPNQPRL